MNKNQHRVIGVAVGVTVTLINHKIKKEKYPDTKFPWEELLFNSGVGFLLATLPDIIEPAFNPHHRKFFHSLACGGLIQYAAYGKHTENMDEKIRKRIQISALVYLSHLVADATTTKSIPIFHPKII
ncbi:MAG TPA: metal-dependent hydrolase [Nitrospinota bacterium]|jgi:membrane-bound metal-dependent hydrolase YbcI (DUF457 family)|nr:metal-dependent hydrolase [Nitrospinota bacterium]|tara:strand:- start:2150 stop:2530 length:381 start_codon:yes stop_codon:yes gene_type:complete